MISVNLRAAAIVGRMIEGSDAIDVGVKRLENGATVIDAGIEVNGSYEAGLLFASACLAGLGEVRLTHRCFRDPDSGTDPGFWLPAVEVSVDRPHIACLASQYAGWAVRTGGYFAIGSGPARALGADEEIFSGLDYRDRADTAVLMLEGRSLPDEDVAAHVALKCGVDPEHLFLLIAPTASLVGSIQIAARSAETGMHKLAELGFDVRRVASAFGLCPLAPVAADDMRAIGRTNDAILYGAEVFFTVRAEDGALADLVPKLPSESSRDYGTPFYDLFRRYGGDFYRIDRMLFSPAEVTVNNLASGRTFRAGRIHAPLLRASLLES